MTLSPFNKLLLACNLILSFCLWEMKRFTLLGMRLLALHLEFGGIWSKLMHILSDSMSVFYVKNQVAPKARSLWRWCVLLLLLSLIDSILKWVFTKTMEWCTRVDMACTRYVYDIICLSFFSPLISFSQRVLLFYLKKIRFRDGVDYEQSLFPSLVYRARNEKTLTNG